MKKLFKASKSTDEFSDFLFSKKELDNEGDQIEMKVVNVKNTKGTKTLYARDLDKRQIKKQHELQSETLNTKKESLIKKRLSRKSTNKNDPEFKKVQDEIKEFDKK